MSNIFSQLQMLSSMNVETTVEHARADLRRIVDYFKAQDDYLELLNVYATNVRNLNMDILLKCETFMVQPEVLASSLPEELQHDSLGFCRNDSIIFSGRQVFPVKDVRGNVMGFVGYDKFEEPKYLDSKNYGYVAKRYSVFGMEELPQYYTSTEPVFFVEGLVCALYLRQCGLQALATLGSQISPYVLEIMRRFGPRAVYICDSDEAGNACRRRINKFAPTVRTVQSCIAKDVDDSRKVDPNFANELRKLKNPYYRCRLFK